MQHEQPITVKVNYTDSMFRDDIDWIRKYCITEKLKFDAIIAPYRGGMPLGVKLSHILDLPLGVINYQRLDGSQKDKKISLAIEPIGKEIVTNEDGSKSEVPVPFIFMKGTVLLVDEICDTGKTMVKTIKYLKLLNPKVNIKVICLYANNDGDEYVISQTGVNITPIRNNENKWIIFPWENDMDTCKYCDSGEPCYNNPDTYTHCNEKNKSFKNEHQDTCFKVGTK